ncbi:ATP-binding protein [Bifidobacterium moukalabense]|uniref:ATP-binding protein n=1 Tax=Bifidobacterium moukalabense TaxID=1333651 RepID=UPI00148566D9|nr:ATP-binding protein [Bifidobacterium moukalabense]
MNDNTITGTKGGTPERKQRGRHTASTLSMGLLGRKPFILRIDTFITPGLPYLALIGLPDTLLSTMREHVKSACVASGFEWPETRVTVNLTPCTLPKQNSLCSLAIAASILTAGEASPRNRLVDTVILGDVNADGTIPPIESDPTMLVDHARRQGVTRIIIPEANLAGTGMPAGIGVIGVRHVGEITEKTDRTGN